jgi:hypothetical protein
LKVRYNNNNNNNNNNEDYFNFLEVDDNTKDKRDVDEKMANSQKEEAEAGEKKEEIEG